MTDKDGFLIKEYRGVPITPTPGSKIFCDVCSDDGVSVVYEPAKVGWDCPVCKDRDEAVDDALEQAAAVIEGFRQEGRVSCEIAFWEGQTCEIGEEAPARVRALKSGSKG